MIRLKHCQIENYTTRIQSYTQNQKSNQQSKNQITRSLERLKLKWKSVFHSSTCKPQSSIPSQTSLINQNFTLNLSLRSLYSQSQVSLVLSLNPSLHTLHNPHSFPNPSCCRHRLITTLMALSHFQPWVKPSHAHGSASQSQDSWVYFLHFSSIFFSILRWVFHLVQFIENLKIIVVRNCLVVLPQSCMCLIPLRNIVSSVVTLSSLYTFLFDSKIRGPKQTK